MAANPAGAPAPLHPAWAAANPATLAWAGHLQRHQSYLLHRFHWYRNGIAGHNLSIHDIYNGFVAGDPLLTHRWNDIMAREAALPPQGPFVPAAIFTPFHRNRLRNLAMANVGPLRTLRPQMGDPVDRTTRRAVTQEYTRAYSLMRSSFRYFKCLGWGGDGIASLWRYSPGPGQEHMVVMKMSNIASGTGPRPTVSSTYIDQERKVITVSNDLVPPQP